MRHWCRHVGLKNQTTQKLLQLTVEHATSVHSQASSTLEQETDGVEPRAVVRFRVIRAHVSRESWARLPKNDARALHATLYLQGHHDIEVLCQAATAIETVPEMEKPRRRRCPHASSHRRQLAHWRCIISAATHTVPVPRSSLDCF